MKNFYLRSALFLVLSLLIVVSCNKDLVSMEDFGFESLSIEDARLWFESVHDPFIFFDVAPTRENQVTIREDGGIVVTPDWDLAFNSSKKGNKVVEVPLKGKGSIRFATEGSKKEVKENGKKEYGNSLMRLVILQEKGSDDLFSFIMVTVGEKEYLEERKFKIWKNTYLRKDKQFDGKTMFYTLEGSYINGWTWEDGEVKYKLKSEDSSQDLKIIPRSCTYTEIFIIYEQCTDWIQYGEISGSTTDLSMTCVYSSEYQGYYIECPPDANDDDGDVNVGGGGLNQSGPGGGVPYSPTPSDKFAKPGMKQTMVPQLPNTCVSSIMEYINNEFCNGNVTEGEIILNHFQNTGNLIPQTGVSSQEIPYLAIDYFNFNSFLTFPYAIDFGDVILADVPSDIPNSTHAVVVIGHKTNGNVIYMDPQEGKLMERPAQEVGVTTRLRIRDCK